jgi:hypothetical protein
MVALDVRLRRLGICACLEFGEPSVGLLLGEV